MQINKRKIPAFTLVDILTGMVVTSIVIAMVFYVFTALNKQVYDYGETRNQINGFLLLKTDLKRQFERADATVTGTPGGFVVEGGSDEIHYLKEGKVLLRKLKEVTDTLTENLEDWTVNFMADKNGNMTENVRSVECEIAIGNKHLSCLFIKDYGRIGGINQSLLNEY